jgi:hypothetical protein
MASITRTRHEFRRRLRSLTTILPRGVLIRDSAASKTALAVVVLKREQTIRRLPGFADVQLIEDWLTRQVPSAAADVPTAPLAVAARLS